MISWIVASHRQDVLQENLLDTLDLGDDELIVVEGAPSITAAYAEGQAKASHPVRCYIHHDVQVCDTAKLRTQLVEACARAGMVGVIGSRDPVMPWWDGDKLGSVVDLRAGVLHFGAGGDCSILDGLLLATSQTVDWDLEAPGFHGYDHDSCRQMLARGFTNFCLTNGHQLVRHNTAGSFSIDQLPGWAEAVNHYQTKWGRHGLG